MNIKKIWSSMWGANALQGQIFMICAGASVVILDALMGNQINFDTYTKMATFLLILPLMLPALGIDTKNEGFAKFILTFGTSFVFGGLPGLLLTNMFGLDKSGGSKALSSLSVTLAVVMVIVMFLCYFQIGHLSRDFLFRTFNALKNPTVPPKLHYLLQAAIFDCKGCSVRPILEKMPARNLGAIIGPRWYEGVVDPGEVDEKGKVIRPPSLWAQMESELDQMSKDSLPIDRLLLRIAIREALIEVVEWGGRHLELLKNPAYADIANTEAAKQADQALESIRTFTTQASKAVKK